MDADTADLVIVGAGAAGLATGIFCARRAPHLRIVCLDGAKHVGAKILVSGGSRCNVTNRVVTERDFWGGSARLVRNVLRAFPAERAVAFFADIGVPLHEEDDGKLFPDSNSARSVLDALVRELSRTGVELRGERRVTRVLKDGAAFVVHTDAGELHARAVVLATGGRSLPKSGSDGFGYELAKRLGHGYVETTPALAPMLLDEARYRALAGVSHRAALMLRTGGAIRTRLEGALLWTHFGVSGPVVLNLSRHWHRARLAGEQPDVLLSVCPEDTFESLETWWLQQEASRPRALVNTVLSMRLPGAVADAWTAAAGVDVTLAHLTRDDRRRLIRTLTELPLGIHDSRGYNFAEATAGGIPLEEIDTARMASRVCPGLYLVGEMLDVDGRLGGFNFQWAWSSGFVAGQAIAGSLAP